jgi:hypothetical protein
MGQPNHEDGRADERFVRQLASAIPDLGELLEEHIRDNDEILSYVFLGAYAWPWLEEQVNSGADQGLRAAHQYLEMLEAELARDNAQTRNLIDVEFLEWFEGPGHEAIKAILPPVLRRKADARTRGPSQSGPN